MVGFDVRERLVGACDVAVPPPLPSALVARLPFFAHNHAFKGRLLVSHHSSQRVPNSFSEKHNATRQFPFSQFDTISPRLQKDQHIRIVGIQRRMTRQRASFRVGWNSSRSVSTLMNVIVPNQHVLL